MSYSYGTQGAPAVGGGAPGLPSRSSVGDIKSFAIHPGQDWLPCNGQICLVSDYPKLASAIESSTLGFELNTGSTGYSVVWTGMAVDDTGGIVLGINGSNNVLRSGNYGASFSTVASGVHSSLLLYAGNGYLLAHSPVIGMAYSTNGGASWTASTGLPSDTDYFNGDTVACDMNGRCMALTWASGTNTLKTYKSTNFGVSWTLASTRSLSLAPNCLAYAGNDIWIAGHQGTTSESLYRSIDFGTTWSSGNSVPGAPIYALASDGNGTLVGLMGASVTGYASNDYGNSWAVKPSLYNMNTSGYPVKTDRNGVWAVSNNNSGAVMQISLDNGTTFFSWTGSTSPGVSACDNYGIYGARSNNTAFYSGFRVTKNFIVPRIVPKTLGMRFYIKAR